MRHLRHRGPVAATRVSAVADVPVRLRFTIEPGSTVEEGIAKGFQAAGCRGGVAAFGSGRCDPFQYVMPAASRDGVHVAWYSDVLAPEGPVELAECVASVGERDDKPFIHCHGRWRTADGMRMGHMLGPNCNVVEPIEVTGIGFMKATFRGMPDAETHFTLFEPSVSGVGTESAVPALLVRVRPNVDICFAIESACRDHRITQAEVFGIGSLNEVHFADGTWMRSHATELLVRRGRVATIEAELRASLDIAVVDIAGNIASGEILRGDNPVCVTFELVIVPDASVP